MGNIAVPVRLRDRTGDSNSLFHGPRSNHTILPNLVLSITPSFSVCPETGLLEALCS